MFVCTSAAMLPTVIVSTASGASNICQSKPLVGATSKNTRKNAANAAVLVATLINAVTGVGAPSYTSGVHQWNGTSATLNPKPTTSNPAPITRSELVAAPGCANAVASRGKLVVAVAP